MSNAIENPFAQVSIGSTVSEDGATMTAPVLIEGLTAYSAQISGQTHMSGSSAYLQGENMNQGSFGVTGSYGVSGVSQYSASVSGYVGNVSAHQSHSTSLSINLIMTAGVEYVDFSNLSVTELVAGLKKNEGMRLEKALECFHAMQSDLRNAEGDKAPDPALVENWIAACDAFYAACGTGVVVGVLWGAYGAVTMEFSFAGQETAWTYGGSGKFTYAGTGASVAVSAAYGGSQSSIASNATAQVSGYYNGEALRKEITDWTKELTKTATSGLDKLGDQKIARNDSLIQDAPDIKLPSPVTPPAKDGVAKMIKDVKDMKGLETFAAAAAFDKYRANGGTDDLDTFLKNRKTAENNIEGIAEGPLPAGDDDSTDTNPPEGGGMLQARRQMLGAAPEAPAGKTHNLSAHYQPMGLWIANWADIFPWLVTGYDNSVPIGAPATNRIRLRTFIQDCRSLERIYHRVFTSGAKMPDVDFRGIAEGFAHAGGLATGLMKDTTDAELAGKIAGILRGLGVANREIYNVWRKTPLLRDCELGVGIVTTEIDTPTVQLGTLTGINELKNQQLGNIVDGMLIYDKTEFDLPNPEASAHSFAHAVKASPVILPTGEIVMFATNGDQQTSGFICRFQHPFSKMAHVVAADALLKSYIDPVTFDSTVEDGLKLAAGRSPVVFQVRGNRFRALGITSPGLDPNDVLNGSYCFYNAIPIPFSAAENIPDWVYGASTTGTGNMQDQLDALRARLKVLPPWSLDSDNWKGIEFDEHSITPKTLRKTYIGLIKPKDNIFGTD